MQPKTIYLGMIAILLIISLCPIVFADYGDGNYGSNKYGVEDSGPSGGGGGGGGGGSYSSGFVTYNETRSSIIINENIAPDVPQSFKIADAEIPITEVIVTTNSSVTKLQLKVTSIRSKPVNLDTPSTTYPQVYRYLSIEKNIDDEKLKSASITFTVTRQWLNTHGLGEDSIVLLRWKDSQWVELPTQKISSDTDSLIFISNSPGFSYFVITSKHTPAVQPIIIPPQDQIVTPPVVPSENPVGTENLAPASPPQSPSDAGLSGTHQMPQENKGENASSKNLLIVVLGIIAVAAIVSGGMYYSHRWKLQHSLSKTMKKSARILSDDQRVEIMQYIEKARTLGYNDARIVQNLRKGGLSDDEIRSFGFLDETEKKFDQK